MQDTWLSWVSAVLVLSSGVGILLYERFAVASRRYFVLTLLVAGWVVALAGALLVADPTWASLFGRTASALQALTASALYWMAVQLTASPRVRFAPLAWLVGGALAGWSLVRPDVRAGVDAVARGDYATVAGVIGLLFIGVVIVLIAAALFEFVSAFRRARSETDRRRHLVMLIALAIGGLAVVEYFIAFPFPGPYGLTNVTITAAIAIIGLGQVRYRSFAADAGFAADEILRAMGDAVLVADEMDVVRIANLEALRLLGGTTAEVVGMSISELLAVEEDGSGAGLPEDPVGGARMRLQPIDGASIPVEVSVERLRGPGSPRGRVVVARDLRQRLASAQALETSEFRYRSLFSHNPAMVFELAVDGSVVQVNPAAAELLGVEPDVVVGASCREMIHPDQLDDAEAAFRGALAGEPQQYQFDIVTPAGGTHTVRGVSIPIMQGDEATGVFGIALDVTEETEAKRELEVQRRYFAELFEGSPEAIAIICASGRVRRVNGEFSRMFGYTSDEAVGQLLDELIVPDGDRVEAGRLGLLAAEGRLARARGVRRRKEGGLLQVSVLARLIRIPGEDLQVYAIYRDIGDQKRTEAKLKAREEELRHAQRLEAVGKLAGGIAHDFNNLVTVINGHVRLVLDDSETDDRFRPDLEEIERAGVRAAALTQQLLAFSRRQVLRPAPLDLNDVVREMERMLGRLITPTIRLEVDLALALPPVLADRGKVEQVVMNLVVNARDAMADGGVLTLGTDTVRLSADDDRLEKWGMVPGRYVRLTVSDTGTGMAPQTLARAFDPFFTTKDHGKGTGLGLATVFGIVKQSGGHVVAESVEGEWSRFHVYLPAGTEIPKAVVAEPEQGGTTAPGSQDADGRDAVTATVLVVEDEAPVRNLTVRVLERHGYAVMAAGDGVAALAIAEAHPGDIHLVVSDLVMPEMGGRELARRIRSERPSTRILFMSGYDAELATGNMDADDFMPKPFTPSDLANRVAAVLARRP